MLVFIHSWESEYCGLHGIEARGVYEVDSIEEADEIGEENALELFDMYYHVFDDCDLYEISPEWAVYNILPDAAERYTREQLDHICTEHDPDNFIKHYCVSYSI